MNAAGRRALLAAILMTLPAIRADAQTYAQVDQAALAGIRDGLYPGAVVIIGRRDSILYSRGYGHFTWNPASRVPHPDSTLWDIASITKVVATAASAMRLVDQGATCRGFRAGSRTR
jgi:CubicO group peptidase (beta-lactamase class C family)